MCTILQQILVTIQRSTTIPPLVADRGQRFWTVYQDVIAEYNDDFLRKYNSDMDTSMIFAGLFSAVSASFASMMRPDLSPDPNLTTQILLRAIVLSLNDTVPPFVTISDWHGPSTTTIWVQCLLYASLSCSLFAALGAVMGKQWLYHYSAIEERGSIEKRGMDRQRKLENLRVWHFRTVLEILPILLQFSLILFGLALTAYMWDVQQAVALVLLIANSIGALSYFTVIFLSLRSKDCPYHSPISTMIERLPVFLVRCWNVISSIVPFYYCHLILDWCSREIVSPAVHNCKRAVFVIVRTSRQLHKQVHRSQRVWQQREDEPPVEESHSIQPIPHAQGVLGGIDNSGASSGSTASIADRLGPLALLWVLETTSLDPLIVMEVVPFAFHLTWDDDLVKRLPWELLERLFVALVECFQYNTGGELEIPPSIKDKAGGICAAFLFCYWEKSVLEPEESWIWEDSSGYGLIDKYDRWVDKIRAIGSPTNQDSGKDANAELFWLMHRTLEQITKKTHWIGRPESTWRRRVVTWASLETLQLRTLVYLNYYACLPLPVVDELKRACRELEVIIEHASGAHFDVIVPCFLASAHSMNAPRHAVHEVRNFKDDTDEAGLVVANLNSAPSVIQYAFLHAVALLDRMQSPQSDDELEGQDCYHLVIKIISKFIQIPRAMIPPTVFLAADIPGYCLATCASLWQFSRFYRDMQTLVLCSQLLDYGAVDLSFSEPMSASTNRVPQRMEGLTYLARSPTHFEWIMGFLDALRNDATGSAEFIDLGQAVSQCFKALSSLRDFGTRAGDSQLHRVLDWVFLLVQQTPTSPGEATVLRDHSSVVSATVACVHALLGSAGMTPLRERHALLKDGVPDFSARWCTLEAHLSRTDRISDAAFERVLVALCGDDADAWMDDPSNSAYMQRWIDGIEQRMVSWWYETSEIERKVLSKQTGGLVNLDGQGDNGSGFGPPSLSNAERGLRVLDETSTEDATPHQNG
ncbi:hypothetical protein EUX98_g5333 [Antrodiella citrinella]|uniref:DUF6535 domain-containing protein n=1 Tax=Antrodiella citrinella TaxID=2447956 RepID=A0A4S4MUJ6_9APHY|nr:hypothetical protein EUX98_g5333 [Antrodiella citrinella]